MLKGILIALLVAAIIVGGYMFYKQHYADGLLGSGDVTVRNAPTSDSKDRADSTTANLDNTPGSEATPTPSRSDAPGTVNTEPVDGSATAASRGVTTTYDGMQPAPGTGTTTMGRTALPVSDTIAPNPPNGTVFAGTGAYTWYRQGSITWRVNSANGRACIAFATMEEWQKPLVYNNGCGRMV